ncbi:4-hydroxyphenylacetate 3-hydroxylase family protein [Sciscionella marina]|uniref:4-hydroxyphenylacetate 3-hydroxylase family protein n=1 Tax=Sciscionella marina TaxID=508770 RepID=UPI00037D3497|nr:4-hydroxyphenylacetate 3-hydroxylase N-terminal domain-containing protein [Sciscionella marina]
MRTGNEYLAALDDDRRVYLDGERVRGIAKHEAFAPIANTIAELIDLGARRAQEAEETEHPIYRIPRSREELRAFREAAQAWARHTHGWVGRSPDHVAAFLSAFAAHPDVFTREDRDYGANVRAYQRKVAQEQLYLSYAIIPPQVSRASTAHDWDGELVQAGVAEERADGIVIRGAQMLATGGAIADEILVSCIKPLTKEDAQFAVSFAVPVGAEGLKLYCRRAYAPSATSSYDYPLSTRYDETDALLVFEDVFIPWERVFVYKDVDGLRRQFFDTGAHVFGNWQAQIRFTVKLQFLLGIARKVAAVNGVDKFPGVVEKLGELAGLASTVESAMLAAEYTAEPDDQGLWRPGARAVYGAMGLQAEIYPRVLAILRDLVGGGVLQVPSSVADLRNPETRADIDRYMYSPNVPAEERLKLFKLAWDAVGSEFAGRHHQYEMFYAGAPFVVKGYAFRNYDFSEPLAELDSFLSGYSPESAD